MSRKKPQTMSKGTRFTDCVPMPTAVDSLAASVNRLSICATVPNGCHLSYRRVVCPKAKPPKLSLQKRVLENVCKRIIEDDLDTTVIVTAEADCASFRRLVDVYVGNLRIPTKPEAEEPEPLHDTDEFRASGLDAVQNRPAAVAKKNKVLVVTTLAGFVEYYMNTATYVVFVTHDENEDVALLTFVLDRCQTDLTDCVVELYVVSKIIELTYRNVFRKDVMFITAGTVNYELIDLPIAFQTRHDGPITCQLVALDGLPEVFENVLCPVCNTQSETPISTPCGCGFMWHPDLLAYVLTLAQYERVKLHKRYGKNQNGFNDLFWE